MTAAELTAIRAALGLSQSELARLIGASIRSLQEWEQGRRRVSPTVAEQVIWLRNDCLPPKPWTAPERLTTTMRRPARGARADGQT